ncbi:MYND finger containing protein, putative [Leishmania lindenbergi]|uniref:MYND finger containing protein n=1 Tax=Leishmania lindenbergi TaxID=651832 RepID=A0AAW2ZXL8_9TRYP
MSVVEAFLRGGAPCTTPSDLTEVLSSAHPPYAHWRCVAYYPLRWHHDAIDNRITAPLFFLLFGHQDRCDNRGADGDTAPTEEAVTVPEAAWHLLYYTILPEGAAPIETFTRDRRATVEADRGGGGPGGSSAAALFSSDGGGVGILRVLLSTVPATLLPSGSLEWYSVAQGIAYERMGLLTASLFLAKLVPGVGEVLSKHWRPMARDVKEVDTGKALGALPTSPFSAGYYVVDGAAVEIVDLIPSDDASSSTFVAHRRVNCDTASVNDSVSLTPAFPSPLLKFRFITATVHDAVQWMCTESKMAAVATDASAPSITEAGWHILYPLMASLRPCMYSSLFEEATDVGRPKGVSSTVNVESLTGLARLRAERDAGIAQWKKQIGSYTSFTVPEEYNAIIAAECIADAPAAKAAHAAADAASSAVPPSTTTVTTAASGERLYQHVLLLQRPIVTKEPIDVDNRNAGPLSPQPISAELHLVCDRGDICYALEQLDNRANLHFVFEDTVHDDGEVLVQLTPVEGVPFCDLEEYFRIVSASSMALSSGGATQYSSSCCPAVVPRVVYRRPTGKVQKANPIAYALTELEVTSPTLAMVRAAAAALLYVSSQLVEVTEATTASFTTTGTSCSAPAPGYTLTVPPVDFSTVSQKKCGWCGRRREVLLRCSGCKAVSYCCKRHQTLDWKEGSHRLECKWWRRARELQERVVVPWMTQSSTMWTAVTADGKPSFFPKSQGWSCAATLIQFVSDINVPTRSAQLKSSSPDNAIHYIHIVGLDTACVGDFVRALAEDSHVREELASLTFDATGGERQYRMLVCSDTFTDAQRNAVWAIRRANTDSLWLTPATGVLGDAWHCEGANKMATQPTCVMALIRLSGIQYHTVERHLGASREGCPRAVLHFGPANGEGCTYLTAALEVFATHDVGVVPLRLVDSSYVGAARTRDAMAARVASSDTCPTTTKSRVAALVAKAKQAESAEVPSDADDSSGSSQGPFFIHFNKEGAVALAAAEKLSCTAGFTSAGPASASVVTPYLNCFLWDALPADYT